MAFFRTEVTLNGVQSPGGTHIIQARFTQWARPRSSRSVDGPANQLEAAMQHEPDHGMHAQDPPLLTEPRALTEIPAPMGPLAPTRTLALTGTRTLAESRALVETSTNIPLLFNKPSFLIDVGNNSEDTDSPQQHGHGLSTYPSQLSNSYFTTVNAETTNTRADPTEAMAPVSILPLLIPTPLMSIPPQTTSPASQVSHKITSPNELVSGSTVFSTILGTQLLSADTSARSLTTHPAARTTAMLPEKGSPPMHSNRKIVLACVLGGVLGLIGCTIIGFCIFNLSGWYKRHAKRRSTQILSPSLSPLEKMNSSDPLAQLDNSIVVRRGSTVYISSPLNGDNILRLKGLPPAIPQKNPLRMSERVEVPGPQFYAFQPRPEIGTPRQAPPPPQPSYAQGTGQLTEPRGVPSAPQREHIGTLRLSSETTSSTELIPIPDRSARRPAMLQRAAALENGNVPAFKQKHGMNSPQKSPAAQREPTKSELQAAQDILFAQEPTPPNRGHQRNTLFHQSLPVADTFIVRRGASPKPEPPESPTAIPTQQIFGEGTAGTAVSNLIVRAALDIVQERPQSGVSLPTFPTDPRACLDSLTKLQEPGTRIRNSTSSSCYSPYAERKPRIVTPNGHDMGVRRYPSSMTPKVPYRKLDSAVLSTISDRSEISKKASLQSGGTPAERVSRAPSLGGESIPEIYDDGQGSYPTLILELESVIEPNIDFDAAFEALPIDGHLLASPADKFRL